MGIKIFFDMTTLKVAMLFKSPKENNRQASGNEQSKENVSYISEETDRMMIEQIYQSSQRRRRLTPTRNNENNCGLTFISPYHEKLKSIRTFMRYTTG